MGMMAFIGILLVVGGVLCIIRGMQGSSPFNLTNGGMPLANKGGMPKQPLQGG